MRSVNGEGARMRVALVTCAQLPALDDDTNHLVGPLHEIGVAALPAIWDDVRTDWAAFDLAVVRSCWDYVGRREEFVRWAARVPRLCNPPDVLAWNTDKRYLCDLAAAGIPTVPTTWVEPHHACTLPHDGEYVIKPAESLASLDTGRYRPGNAAERRLAQSHVTRLQQRGRVCMIQPYMSAIDTEGETSLVFLGGAFSHAVRKAAVLSGPDAGIDRRFMPQGGLTLRRCRPTPAQVRLAERVLAAVPGGRERLLYARVDLVPGANGHPVLLELELAEPQLYLGMFPAGARRFARAIRAWRRIGPKDETQRAASCAPFAIRGSFAAAAGRSKRALLPARRPRLASRRLGKTMLCG